MDKRPQQLNESITALIAWLLNSGLTWEQIWEFVKPYLQPSGVGPIGTHKGDTPASDLYKTVAKEERMLDRDWNSLVESAAQVGSRGLNEQLPFPQRKRQEKPVSKFPAYTPPDVGKESQLVDVEAEATEIIKMMLQQRQGQQNSY